jgi:transcriptional regulator with XRE-family HTH domain
MSIGEQVRTARKKKGLTQEELADATNITVRTIQRIEGGASVPRPYTLRILGEKLDVELLIPEEEKEVESIPAIGKETTDLTDHDFLHTLILSCFTYLVIPYIHFLIPARLLKKETGASQSTVKAARAIIRSQVYWVIGINATLLLTLLYNMGIALPMQVKPMGFLLPVVIFFFGNAIYLCKKLYELKKQSACIAHG